MHGQRTAFRNGMRWPLLVLLPLLTGMAESPQAPLDGHWGGARTNIRFSASGAAIEQDCATGSVEGAVTPDAGGRFVAVGQWWPEGGPVAADRPTSAKPARLAGTINGDRMLLTIAIDGAEASRLELVRGKRVKLVRCL